VFFPFERPDAVFVILCHAANRTVR
jgi:hypothetical protein